MVKSLKFHSQLITVVSFKDIDSAMKDIGFVKEGSRHYIHPECKHLFIEFCGGPTIGIGDDTNIKPKELF